MTETTVTLIFAYYSIMWAANVGAYVVVSIGLYHWKKFVHGMAAENMIRMSLKVTAAFAISRLGAGFAGLYLYEFNGWTPIETILVLGVTSLFLNTTYIMSHGYFLYKDASRAWKLPPEKQAEVRQAMTVFDSLRTTMQRVTANG